MTSSSMKKTKTTYALQPPVSHPTTTSHVRSRPTTPIPPSIFLPPKHLLQFLDTTKHHLQHTSLHRAHNTTTKPVTARPGPEPPSAGRGTTLLNPNGVVASAGTQRRLYVR